PQCPDEMTADDALHRSCDAVRVLLPARQQSPGDLSEAALFSVVISDLFEDQEVKVRVRRIEMDARNPSPFGSANIGPEFIHRFARGLAQPLFTFLISFAQLLEVLSLKTDREVDQVALGGSASPVFQVPVRLAVAEIVLTPVCKQRSRSAPFALRV